MSDLTKEKITIRHLMGRNSLVFSMCGVDAPIVDLVRNDLGSARYKRLGVIERFKGERPYRICKRCIRTIERREFK